MNNYDRVQQMLNSYMIWINDIKNLELEIEELSNYDITGIGFGEKTGKTFKINNEVENKIINKEHKINEYEKLKRINEINIEKINNAINILGEFEIAVVKLKYLSSPTPTWKTISYKLNASISACRQAKIRAINKMIPLLCR